ncbi:MAG: ABC transporter permease [Bacteroidetes bacterium]|nr:ABC transporter permease [Bacteroidota bacterium]
MIKNYFITAWRNFRKNKLFSLINVSGLAIGISASLIIYLMVQFEFSYDNFHKDGDRIYRVVSDLTFPGNEKFYNSGVPVPMPVAVRNDITGLETVTHFITSNEMNVMVQVNGSQSPAIFKKQKDILYADEYYFSLISYNWLAGSAQTALKDPHQVVLTDERAKAYFGNLAYTDMLGKTITYDDSIKATVSGIVQTPVEKATDFRFKEMISMATVMSTNLKDNFGGDDWNNINSVSQLFIKLKPGVTAQQINNQFPALRKKYLKRPDNLNDDTKNLLQPLSDIHFNSTYDAFDQRQANKNTLYGLLVVAAFLLLLGCINFINLTTAQSSQRAKEIGIRKTLGSDKKQLIFQFLAETLLLTALATLLSIAITPGLLKIFKDFLPPEISFASVNQWHVWVFLAVLVVAVTLLSGFYPALILTKFKPVAVIKNQLSTQNSQTRKAWFRKTLTVTQFVIAQFLVIATIVVTKQIHYSLTKELGYKKDAIVTINTPWNFGDGKKDTKRFVLLQQIKALPEVENVALGDRAPAHNGASSTTLKVNTGKNTSEIMVEVMNADPAYFDIYKMKLAAGRVPAQSDSINEYAINETYAKVLGFTNPEDAVGKTIERHNKQTPIVGVLKDFNVRSTHEAIKPLAYASEDNRSYMLHIALKPEAGNPGLWKNALGKMEKAYKQLYPDNDFNYDFFDATIASFYKKESDISTLLSWSSGLSIFISCLGLLGLVIYTTNTRTKEIGIRKVLGASVVQIISLLSKDLLSLVLVAFIVAVPLAWVVTHEWLQNFVYRTNISWWIFGVCGAGMMVIALLVLMLRTVKTAFTNPVKSLRTE